MIPNRPADPRRARVPSAPPQPRPAPESRPVPAPPARQSPAEYWRVDRVARHLDVSRKRVYQLVQEGRLVSVRLGPRQMRINRASLDAYLAELERRAAEDLWA
jgi:excisionase family DNA binding protein